MLTRQIVNLNEKIKQKKKLIDKIPFTELSKRTQSIEEQLGIKILQYENDRNWNFYGHF